jgi:hypothetical protein
LLLFSIECQKRDNKKKKKKKTFLCGWKVNLSQ